MKRIEFVFKSKRIAHVCSKLATQGLGYRPYTACQLAEHFKLTEKSIRRIMETMAEMGLPILINQPDGLKKQYFWDSSQFQRDIALERNVQSFPLIREGKFYGEVHVMYDDLALLAVFELAVRPQGFSIQDIRKHLKLNQKDAERMRDKLDERVLLAPLRDDPDAITGRWRYFW